MAISATQPLAGQAAGMPRGHGIHSFLPGAFVAKMHQAPGRPGVMRCRGGIPGPAPL